MSRLGYLVAIGLFLAITDVRVSVAQDYPNQPIRLIVPNSAGGLTDIIARVVAERLTKRLGQPVIVMNQPGADTVLGVTAVTHAKPDGYTLLMADSAAYSMAPQIHKVTYDSRKDLTLVSRIYDGAGIIMSANPGAPYKSIKDLVAYAKANPGKADFASGSAVLQITGEMLKQQAGIDIRHVPYRGTVQAVTDTLAGHVGMVVTGIATVTPYYAQGKLIPLAIATAERSRAIPNVPTFVESGYPGVVMANWFGFLAPRGLPQSIVDRLNTELAAIVDDPALKEIAEKNHLNLRLQKGDELRRELDQEYERIGAAIAASGMRKK